MSNIRVLSLIKISIFNLSTISNHPRVRECKFLISFYRKTCTVGPQHNNIPCMGGVFDKLDAKFKNRT